MRKEKSMRLHRALHLVTSTAGLLLLLGSQQGMSQASADYAAVKGMDERFRMDLGGFAQKFETTIRLDSEKYGKGTELSLEDDLGLSSDQINFRADGYWRFGRHGRIEFAYTGWNRNASHVLDKDIVAGGTTYHAGATLDSKLRVSLVELYYGYSFWNTGKFEAGLEIGATALVNNIELEGTGTIEGGGQSAGGSFSRQSRSVVAPVPAIGANVRYTIIPGLLVSGKIRGLGATIDNIKASVLEGRAILDYYPWKNVGFGAGYDYMDIKVTKETDPTVEFEYRYSGPLVYLSLVL
jgi:hypothetical protein